MKLMLLVATILFAASSQAGAQAANGDLYTCKFPNTKTKLISPEIILARRDSNGEFEVLDEIIMWRFAEPIDAKVARDGNKKLTLKWEYPIPLGGLTAKVQFSLTYDKSRGSAVITSRPLGYDNFWRAQGKCDKRRGRV